MWTQAEWDIKELPVSSQGKVASVHNRPAACHGPGKSWDVTSRMKSALSPPAFGIFIISGWACECLTQLQWLPGPVIFFKIRCIKSLFCYFFCELIGSTFAKFCAGVRAGCSEQTCGASFAAASVSHSFLGSSPGPDAQPAWGSLDTPAQLMEREETLPFWAALELNVNYIQHPGRALV